MNLLAQFVLDKKEIKSGIDLGLKGYESILVDGNTVYGKAWIDITVDNMMDYDF